MTAVTAPAADTARARVLVLTSTFPRRHGDTTPPFVLDLCRELARAFDVHVLAPHGPGACLEEVMDGVHVYRFRYLPESWQRLAYDGGITARLHRHPWLLLQVPCLLVAQCFAALRLARALRPAVIHAHWLLPQGLVALLVRALSPGRPPVLCTLHGTDMHGWNFPPLPAVKARLLRAMTLVTAVSESLRAAALAAGADPARIDVVPMGVDVDGVFRAGPESGRVPGSAVFAGRLVPGKGVEVLLQAWSQVPAGIGTMLTLVGDGPLRPALEVLAGRPGLAGRVTFTGALPPPAVAERFRAASVAVFPFTGAEGLGIVVVEAQACGCPVVVSAIPAMKQLVQDGSTGLVVPIADAGAVRAAIERVLGNPALGAVLGITGCQAARGTFGVSTAGARYRDVITRLMGATGSSD